MIDPTNLSPDAAYLLKILRENEDLKAENLKLRQEGFEIQQSYASVQAELDLRGAPLQSDNKPLSAMGRLRDWWVTNYRKIDSQNGPTCFRRMKVGVEEVIWPYLLADEARKVQEEGEKLSERKIPDGWGEITTYRWKGWLFERTFDRNKGGDEKWECVGPVTPDEKPLSLTEQLKGTPLAVANENSWDFKKRKKN